MADMTSAGGFCTSFKRQAITCEVTLTARTSSKVFLLLIILQVVRMITTSKGGFCDKSNAEILNNLKRWVSEIVTWILSVKPTKRLILLFALWGITASIRGSGCPAR